MKIFGTSLATVALAFSVNANASIDSVPVTEKTIGLTSTAQGFYFADGRNFSSVFRIDEGDRNNYFVFDLSSIDLTELKSVKLHFGSAEGYSSTGELVYEIFDVNHGVNELVSGNVNTSIFNDLQSGVSYGSADSYDFYDFSNFELNFNKSGIDAIKSSNGLFAFGGALVSRTPGGDSDLFYTYDSPNLFLTFNVTPVPEADTYAMFLAGVGLMGLTALRRNHVEDK